MDGINLKKQFVISFIFVGVLPLIALSLYIVLSNTRLAMDLYEQNLYNSTEIQTDILDDNINRFMVEASRFASTSSLKSYLSSPSSQDMDLLKHEQMPTEVMKFTDKTLDSVSAFAVLNNGGKILYSNGSNKEQSRLAEAVGKLRWTDSQLVMEMPLKDQSNDLMIVTPVRGKTEDIILGQFVVVYNNDYFLKTISSHRQIESSNSFIFCKTHKTVVEAKQEISGDLTEFAQLIAEQEKGYVKSKIDGKNTLLCFNTIAKTPWVLVNSLPAARVYEKVFSNGVVSLVMFAVLLLAILLLSRIQSERILSPLKFFLDQVEAFFVSGGKLPSSMEMDQKTEIGYLAEKFSGMAADISAGQERLTESNYLYQALLSATYDLQVALDYQEDRIGVSDQALSDWFNALPGEGAAEKLQCFFEAANHAHTRENSETLQKILLGEIREPAETELCCRIGFETAEHWYRIIAVPILEKSGSLKKMVLHFEDITTQKLEQIRLLESSQKETLCGLLNKQAFMELVKKFAGGKCGACAMFFVDLDNFKQVNDTLGHGVGDETLIAVSKILTAQFRGTDLVARYGGDEFVIFAPGMNRDGATQKAQAILKEFPLEPGGPGSGIFVTASIGIYLSIGVQNLERMVKGADDAMYQAKQNGKSQFCMIEEEKGKKR